MRYDEPHCGHRRVLFSRVTRRPRRYFPPSCYFRCLTRTSRRSLLFEHAHCTTITFRKTIENFTFRFSTIGSNAARAMLYRAASRPTVVQGELAEQRELHRDRRVAAAGPPVERHRVSEKITFFILVVAFRLCLVVQFPPRVPELRPGRLIGDSSIRFHQEEHALSFFHMS